MLDAQAVRHHYLDIAVGEVKSQGTYAHQVWLITDDDGKVRSIFMTGATPSAIEISSSSNKFCKMTSDTPGTGGNQTTTASSDRSGASSLNANGGNSKLAMKSSQSIVQDSATSGASRGIFSASAKGASANSATSAPAEALAKDAKIDADYQASIADLSTLPDEDSIPFRKISTASSL